MCPHCGGPCNVGEWVKDERVLFCLQCRQLTIDRKRVSRYDEKQANAIDRPCVQCGVTWAFTDHAQTVCLTCRELLPA